MSVTRGLIRSQRDVTYRIAYLKFFPCLWIYYHDFWIDEILWSNLNLFNASLPVDFVE